MCGGRRGRDGVGDGIEKVSELGRMDALVRDYVRCGSEWMVRSGDSLMPYNPSPGEIRSKWSLGSFLVLGVSIFRLV